MTRVVQERILHSSLNTWRSVGRSVDPQQTRLVFDVGSSLSNTLELELCWKGEIEIRSCLVEQVEEQLSLETSFIHSFIH